jgi:hypothetical protein
MKKYVVRRALAMIHGEGEPATVKCPLDRGGGEKKFHICHTS